MIWALVNDPADSKEFIRYTVLMAKDLHARMNVLYVQNPQAFPLGTPDSLGNEVVQVQENLREIASAAEKTVNRYIGEIEKEIQAEIPVEFQTEFGNASLILKDKVLKGKEDMVMLQGKPEEAVWAKISTNMDIIRNVHCPVWIIPPHTKYRPLKHIIYATDYQKEDIPMLKRLIRLTRTYEPEITALHIVDNEDFEEKVRKAGFDEIIKQKTGSDRISVQTVADQEDLDVPEILNEFADRTDTDLVAVLKENRHFLERMFKGSFTRKLIKQAQRPVLVFHEK